MRVFTSRSLSVVAIAVAGVLASQSDVHAFGHHWGASCGSSGGGGYSGSAGSAGGWGGSWGGGGSSGSWGGGRRHHGGGFLHRIFHRHRNNGSHGGSWGGSNGGYVSNGSAGSWGGSYGGSYGGTYGGSYGGSYNGVYDGGTVIGPVETYDQGPAILPEGGETPTPPVPPPTDGNAPMTLRGTDSAAMLTVSVPADASVYVNGNRTTSTGELRHYVSRGLTPGAAYTYRIRAEFTRGGEVVTETKTVRLTAGGTASLAFNDVRDDSPLASDSVETTLTLHVPADAKVILAGNETQQAGPTRHFVTSHLASGEKWSDYVVRVEVERDGQILADEKTLDLVGGQTRELVMDLDAPKIAAR
jgi:uncharacterized protein (TIGR03000 family)